MSNILDCYAYVHIGAENFGYKHLRDLLKEEVSVTMWLSDNQGVFI